MPFGDMTITLDDVSYLLHLSIMGDLWNSLLSMNEEGSIDYAIDLLGVPLEETILVVHARKSLYYKLE